MGNGTVYEQAYFEIVSHRVSTVAATRSVCSPLSRYLPTVPTAHSLTLPARQAAAALEPLALDRLAPEVGA